MLVIRYDLCTRVNHGTEEEPIYEDVLSAVEMDWNEANEAVAEAEAYRGIYYIVDDGQPTPAPQPTDAERIAELEATISVLLGVNE